MVKQQVYDVVIAAFRSPQDWCCAGFAAFRIDRCAGLDEEMAESIVIVDGRPLYYD